LQRPPLRPELMLWMTVSFHLNRHLLVIFKLAPKNGCLHTLGNYMGRAVGVKTSLE